MQSHIGKNPRSVVEQAASMARLVSPKRNKNGNELQVAVMQWELTLVEHESKFLEVVRTDGEPSICELIRHVRELRVEETTTVDKISPLRDSAGNGIAVTAILTVGGLVRTTKAVAEEKVLEGRDAGPRLTVWMEHHAAQVM